MATHDDKGAKVEAAAEADKLRRERRLREEAPLHSVVAGDRVPTDAELALETARDALGLEETRGVAPEGTVPDNLDTAEVAAALEGTGHTIGTLLQTTAERFLILHDSVGPYLKGRIVTLQQLGGEPGGVTRLIELGAIETYEAP